MASGDWIIVIVAAALVGAGVWLFSRWWFGRQLRRAQEQIDKVDKAGKMSAQQNVQARKQIETLQKELASAQKNLNDARRHGGTAARAGSGSTAQERAAAAEAALAAVAPAPSTTDGTPPTGFADTQPMSDSRFR